MATLSELRTARTTAGARYAAAIVELRASYVDLSALDRALANDNVDPGRSDPIQTFAGLIDDTPMALVHASFAPRQGLHWEDQAKAAFAAHLANFT